MNHCTPPRLIAHLDMDAFYASVELRRRPELRGQPVVIGGARHSSAPAPGRLGDYRGRGVVTTATYEARAFGIHSGMGLMKAGRLAPDALLLPADFELYRSASRQFKAAVAELAPAIEDRGIDEIYIDLSALPGVHEPVGYDPLGGVRALAQEIKNNVRRHTGLSCSIGVAPNKLLAKICSDLDKPDGLVILTPVDLAPRIWPLPVRAIKGIGPKAGARLAALGVSCIGDLARCELSWLQQHFGAHQGLWLFESAHGRDERPVQTASEPVSMSRETTFERDLHPRHDRAELGERFTQLCQQVAQDLQRQGYVGRTVSIKLRFDDFRTVTRDHTESTPTADAAEIRARAGACLRRVPLSRRLRLLGVRVGALVRLAPHGPAAVLLSSGTDAHEHVLNHPHPPGARPTTGSARSRKAQTGSDGATLPLFDDLSEPGREPSD